MRIVRSLALLCALLMPASAARAQTCIQAAEYDSLPKKMIAMVRQYTVPQDSGWSKWGSGIGYPVTSQVTHVTKEQDCKKARDAYRANTAPGGGWTNRVVVIKAGQTYTVLDPGYAFNQAEKALTYVLLDNQFRFLKRLGG